MKAPERLERSCSEFFIANFEHISHLVLVFLFFDFEQANAPAGFSEKTKNATKICTETRLTYV